MRRVRDAATQHVDRVARGLDERAKRLHLAAHPRDGRRRAGNTNVEHRAATGRRADGEHEGVQRQRGPQTERELAQV